MSPKTLEACTAIMRLPSRAVIIGLAALLSGCASAGPQLPEPRPIIIHSGARLRVDVERMTEINSWVTRENRNIEDDPSFLVRTNPVADQVYLWENLKITADTVDVGIDPRATDTRLVHHIYGHLHLMVDMGRQEEWLPEAPDAVGYELERAILKRCSDAWLLGRTVFDTQPYGPLDELMYATENGYLDAFIFTARPSEFATARAEWARANPGQADEYRDWFLETFNREPPGLRAN